MLNTFQQADHPVLPNATHDELVRQNFSKGLRGYIQREVLPGLTPLFRKVSANKQPGVDFDSRHEIRKAMKQEGYFQCYAAMNRTAQELLWLSVVDSIESDWPRLSAEVAKREQEGGELRIPETFDIPRYVTAVDIHCMPGGYASRADAEQFAAGAMYERGVYLYSMGYGGPNNDGKGRSVANYIRKNMPDFKPRRILDMGCTVGHSTLPFEELFPGAEVWGIDVTEPLVRYAHARAVAMGSLANFAQMNAEKTEFEDGYFDLIVSHILLHETSGKAMPRIFEESYRLLSSGGWMVHCDLPPFDLMDPLTQFILDNETYYNNEPFWGAMREMDQVALAKQVGFDPETVRFDTAPMVIQAYADQAHKGYDSKTAAAVADRKFKAGEYAPGGGWEVLIGRKA